jgi:hypothetical protein
MRLRASLVPRAATVCGWLSLATTGCGETTVSIQSSDPETGVELERGLLLYLPLDEIEAGSTALDASGHGHDGTPSASPPTPSVSVPPVGFANPRSLAFDGVEQLLDLGNPASLDLAGALTLSAWIRPLSLDGYRNVVAHGFRWSPNEEVALRIHDGTFEFTAWNGVDHMATAPVPAGDVDSWHHLAGVNDGVTYRIYRDGELIAEQADTFTPTRVDAPWAIGGRSTSMPVEPRSYNGLIDEVRIYDRALSADEVRALFRR